MTRPGRDDRLAAYAREAVCERRGVKHFYRPCRRHFEAVINLTVGKGERAEAIGNGSRVGSHRAREELARYLLVGVWWVGFRNGGASALDGEHYRRSPGWYRP